ncbi:MAG: cytochrome c-type biogenesis protein CcmH [Rhizobiales bacterium]|nr:cytochrome c-type biogenesis protein CcmH [Hyphomicrobiales bacterium]
MMRFLTLLCLLVALALPVRAVEPGEALKDPALEARAREISQELRCLVCQNQSIDDSHAPLARDLRLLVRDRLKAGDSDEQVLDYIVARYGEFVLMKPRFGPDTYLLWLGPGLALAIGIWILFAMYRRNATAPEVPSLSSAEIARLDAIVKDHER